MKKSELLTKILIILIIIAVTLIAFLGIYVKEKNTTKNIVKEDLFGMNIKGYRFISLNPNTSTKEVYYDVEGKKVENESEAKDDNGNLKEGYTKKDEKINKDEVLTDKNYEKMKEIIEKRLERLGVTQYNIKLDKWTGQIIVELAEDSKTDEIISYLNYKGQFAILDKDTKELLIGSDRVKDAKVMYSDQQVGRIVYINIELDKEGKEKLKEVTSTYVKQETSTENNGENSDTTQTTEKQVTMQVENQDLFSSAFEQPITDGIISITLGTATTNEEFSEYIEQANTIATMIGAGETSVEYTLNENFAVSPIINRDILKNVVIITAMVIAIALIFWIIKYKLNGLYGAISYIGAISITYILLKYTNVFISLETIVAMYALLIANYVFITTLLKRISNKQEVEKAFTETILEKLNIIVPISIISVVFTFMGWLPVFSMGMTLFWGIVTIMLENYLFTKNLLINEDTKE